MVLVVEYLKLIKSVCTSWYFSSSIVVVISDIYIDLELDYTYVTHLIRSQILSQQSFMNYKLHKSRIRLKYNVSDAVMA